MKMALAVIKYENWLVQQAKLTFFVKKMQGNKRRLPAVMGKNTSPFFKLEGLFITGFPAIK
jgi:hypothetical protein